MKSNVSSLKSKKIALSHPCLSAEAHNKFSRIHIPIAPKCNIKCRYCVRKYDCVNESRPGVTSRVLTVDEALFRLRLLAERDSTLRVIGVAGPGDALANEETFEFFRSVKKEFCDMVLCVSTNGLLLPEKLDELVDAGVDSITITINTLRPSTANKIYSFAIKNNKTYSKEEAAELIVASQKEGLIKAVSKGCLVKINTVLMPGINSSEVEEIAKFVSSCGAYTQNIIGLIPQGEMSQIVKPSCHDIYVARSAAQKYMPQMSHCTKCRSDAFGKLGEDKDIEYEALNALFGIEYCENL